MTLGSGGPAASGRASAGYLVPVLDPPAAPELLYELHTPPAAIGKAAGEAEVGRLLLSHLTPEIVTHFAGVKKSIARSYAGPVALAEDREKYRDRKMSRR